MKRRVTCVPYTRTPRQRQVINRVNELNVYQNTNDRMPVIVRGEDWEEAAS